LRNELQIQTLVVVETRRLTNDVTTVYLHLGNLIELEISQQRLTILLASVFAEIASSMPSRKEKIVDKASDIVYKGDAPLRASKLPRPLQFPLVVILSLSLSALLYSFAAEYTASELSAVSRSLNKWWEVGVLVAWRT
jgi:hypothetical protein